MTGLAAGDFNGDGRADLATPYDDGNSAARLHVWLGGLSCQGSDGWWATDTSYTLDAVDARMN